MRNWVFSGSIASKALGTLVVWVSDRTYSNVPSLAHFSSSRSRTAFHLSESKSPAGVLASSIPR